MSTIKKGRSGSLINTPKHQTVDMCPNATTTASPGASATAQRHYPSSLLSSTADKSLISLTSSATNSSFDSPPDMSPPIPPPRSINTNSFSLLSLSHSLSLSSTFTAPSPPPQHIINSFVSKNNIDEPKKIEFDIIKQQQQIDTNKYTVNNKQAAKLTSFENDFFNAIETKSSTVRERPVSMERNIMPLPATNKGGILLLSSASKINSFSQQVRVFLLFVK